MSTNTVEALMYYFIIDRTLSVLGAGLMGAGIVQVSIDKGYKVLMKDMNMSGLARGEDQIYKGLNTKTKRKQITRYERQQEKVETLVTKWMISILVVFV